MLSVKSYPSAYVEQTRKRIDADNAIHAALGFGDIGVAGSHDLVDRLQIARAIKRRTPAEPAAAPAPVVALGVVLGLASPEIAARSVVASLVASAFFRYTTLICPAGPPMPGRSSCAISVRTLARRAGLLARTIRLLLRASAITVMHDAVAARDAGTPVIVVSTELDELRTLCDRIVVIAKGRVVAQGTADELRAQAGEANLEDAFVQLIGSEEGLHA